MAISTKRTTEKVLQGHYCDVETELHYNRHRYYDLKSGSFITQDPIGLLGDLNNYQYVPNPIHWVDPLGLSCKDVPNKTFSTLDEFSSLKVTGNSVGDLSNVKGATVQDIVANIPDTSSVRKFKPVEGKSQIGLEYKWVDENGITNRLRIFDPDPTHEGSNAANGWIARWQQKGGYYNPETSSFAH